MKENTSLAKIVLSDVGANCFLNALARECPLVFIDKSNANQINYFIPLLGQRKIRIALNYFSTVGLHEYSNVIYLVDNEAESFISFESLLNYIIYESTITINLSEQQKSIFVRRVLESKKNTQDVINFRQDLDTIFSHQLNFQQAEQGGLAGHSVHPAPKSREQFSAQDALKYSPEYQGKFALCWYGVSEKILTTGSSGQKNIINRLDELLQKDALLALDLQEKLPSGFLLFPVHPWQDKVIKAHVDVQDYLTSGLIIDFGAKGKSWYPTSSTRSLYSPALPYMLKFSLNVKLTNSMRNLSLKEVVRGTRLQDVYDSALFNQNAQLSEHLKVMQEPAFMGLNDKKGNIIDESIVAFRENLLAQDPQEEAVVLTTLSQHNPSGEDNLLAQRIKHLAKNKQQTVEVTALQWFDDFCQQVVVPLFSMQANFGIVFLAHQQNIVVRMKEGLLNGMYFRDCQGTGYTDLAFDLFPECLQEGDGQPENYWDQGKVRRYFAYYLIVNSTYNVMAAIASRCGVAESQLLSILRDSLVALKASGVRDSRCLDYVLNEATLCCKGNFFCYLQNMNENSIPDPAVIYFDLPNPLFAEKEHCYA